VVPRRTKLRQLSEKDTQETIEVASSIPTKDIAASTMVHAIIQSDLPASDKTLERVFQEVATVTAAGIETTANTLRLILFHVYSNQKILRSLREELVSASHGSPERIALKILEQLP
jgi:cytochrome P450